MGDRNVLVNIDEMYEHLMYKGVSGSEKFWLSRLDAYPRPEIFSSEL